jgi:glycolate oxidase FAD binding subunit
LHHIIDQFAETIRGAAARKAPLRIRGGGTKDFYGGELRGDVLDTRVYSGIVDYEPTELVITARAGTPLTQIEAALRGSGQMLAFEPPRYGESSTLGGCMAAGLSGPRRPYAGSARDFVLGVRMLDGKGADLKFGGQVMKNVAGYDVSRLMTGSLGTLGLLTEISLKVLPLPPVEITLEQERSPQQALELMNAWAGKPYPITATCHMENRLYVRLSGAEPAVRAARQKLGGEGTGTGALLWDAIRDHSLALFDAPEPLWRVSLKPTAPPLAVDSKQLVEWNGALRWIAGEVDAAALREAAAAAGGHATLFRRGDKAAGVFQPLAAPLLELHRRLKDTFDPARVLNIGRMYPDF